VGRKCKRRLGQVGLDVGAEFENRSRNEPFSHTYGAALVRRTEKWTITLEYRAEEDKARGGTVYETTTTMHAPANSEINDVKLALLGYNERIQQLIPEALGRSSSGLVLDKQQRRVVDRSNRKTRTGSVMRRWEGTNWMLPITNPVRLRALFRLFEVALEELEKLGQLSELELNRLCLEEEEKEDAESMAEPRQIAAEFVRISVQFFSEELGLDARVSNQNPLSPEAALTQAPHFDDLEDYGHHVETWLEIAEGSIHWVRLDSTYGGNQASFYVPDSRIRANFPLVSIFPAPAKSFPVFGRPKGIRWWVPGEGNSTKGFSRRVAGSLGRNIAIARGIQSYNLLHCYYVSSGPGHGCWTIGTGWTHLKWSGPLWEHLQEMAETLLATPIPTGE
jgi:hypothetical protein